MHHLNSYIRLFTIMTNHHPPTALTGGPPPIFSLFCEHVVFERKNQKTLEPPLISVRLGYYNVLLVLQAPASAAHSLHAPPLPLPSRSPAQPRPRAQPLPSPAHPQRPSRSRSPCIGSAAASVHARCCAAAALVLRPLQVLGGPKLLKCGGASPGEGQIC